MTSEQLSTSLQETLEVFQAGATEPLTTVEVAAELDLGRRSTYARLERLAEQGRIETKKVSASGRVWWRPRTPTGDGGESESATEQHARELEEYETIVSAIQDGVYVLDEEFRFIRVNDAYVEMTGYARDELLGRHCSIVVDDDVAAHSAELLEEIAAGDGKSATLEADIERADGSRLRAESNFTTLPGTDDRGARKVGVVRDVSERVTRERELELQRERLAALNHLNDVVREITDVVIDQSTREEIERTVCEALSDTDSYAFAWIGEADSRTDAIRLRTEAGVEGYLDDVTVPLDPDDPSGNGPTARAIRTGEIQVISDALTDEDVAAWRDHVRRHGFRSMASVPIVHQGVPYGVLNVYASRPAAFAGEERKVIAQLGEVVGHSIAAVERKRALTSDQVHEIDFQLRDVFSVFDVGVTAEDRITLDQSVPVEDGEYLVYGTASEADIAVVDAIVEALPNWSSFRVVGETFDRTKFELRLSESSVLTMLAARGGYVEGAWIENGDFRMTVQLPSDADIRQFVDAVLETYPAAAVRAQRQVTRTDESANRIQSIIEEELTDRQWTALATAYYAGYFEWPRESTGKEIARTLGVSAPTFSQHLRAAENKVFEATFDPVA